MQEIERLDQNVEQYISKHNKRRFLHGCILTLLSAGSVWIALALLEYFGNFQEATRTALFFAFMAFTSSLVVFQVIIPLLKLMGVMSSIDEPSAARSIGEKLDSVEDKLVNLLNLKAQAQGTNSGLVLASLDQKAAQLNAYQFDRLINFRSLLTLGRYLVAPVIVFAFLALWNPATVLDSSKRLFSYNQSFIPPAPFEFKVLNNGLNAIEGKPFSLEISTSGNALPDHVFIELADTKIRMKQEQAGQFSYTFDRVQRPINFNLSAAGVVSKPYSIKVLAMPKMIRNITQIKFPEYTGLSDVELVNRNQLSIPEGSIVSWKFETKSASNGSIILGNSSTPLDLNDPTVRAQILTDTAMRVVLRSEDNLSDTLNIEMSVVKDAYPQIIAREQTDSLSPGVRFFAGELSDDYGVARLNFHVDRLKGDQRISVLSQNLSINQNQTTQSFSYLTNLDSLSLNPGEDLEYYFEVWDNDAINGSKSVRSPTWKLEMPSEAELKSLNDEASSKSKDALKSHQQQIQKSNKELDELKKNLLQKKKPDWQDKERMKQLLEDQKKLMKSLEKKAEQQRKQTEFNNQFNEYSEELLQKQEQIQELFDELFDEEFKEKYDEYNELLEKLNKDQMLDKMDEMKLDNEQLEKELDRTLELFKQLEFEQKLEEVIEKTEELKEEQEELEQQTEDKANDKEDLKKDQAKIEKELDELSKEIDKLEELNESLEEKNELPDPSQEEQEAKDGMKEAQEELSKNNRKKAKEQQKKAKESLEQMQSKLQSFQEEQSKEKQSENLEDMRQILENLIDLSHHQELVMQEYKGVSARDPRFVSLVKEQKDIMDDTKVVEDSILALSKRVPEISNKLNDEISEVKSSMDIALDNMVNQRPNQEKRHKQNSLVNQQLSMTALNNLAVMFDAMIQQAQKQANSKMKGNGKCDKPGSGKGGKPSASDMKKAQEQLNKQLEELKKAMEKGEKPDGKKPGQKPGMGMGGQSKELARMAAQQGAIREQLRKLSESLDKEGSKPGSGLKELEKMMEQTEEDLLYQNITQETMRRQQKILTKLLESENADREREMDKKRESKSARDQYNIPADIWEEYLLQKEKELELYKTLPPNLKPYYRNRVNGYFSQFAQ